VSEWELRTARSAYVVREMVDPGPASPALLQHGDGRRFRVQGSGELVDGEVVVPFRLAPDCDVVILDRVPDA
jgi:alpha-galactosidase